MTTQQIETLLSSYEDRFMDNPEDMVGEIFDAIQIEIDELEESGQITYDQYLYIEEMVGF